MDIPSNILLSLYDNNVSLDDIAARLPCVLHVNRIDDFQPIYLDPHHTKIFESNITSNHDFSDRLQYIHPDDLKNAIQATQHYLDNIEDYNTISFMQRILYPKKDEYSTYYTTSMLIECRGGLVSFTVPIDDVAINGYPLGKILRETDFIKKNAWKFTKLTAKEQELIRLWVGGGNNASIAQLMELSEHTIKSYKKRVYQKLEINQYHQLYEYAKAFGFA